jgi:hypothetical protein
MTDPDPDDPTTRSTPMTEHEPPATVYEEEELAWYDEPAAGEQEALPARPRRKVLTPVTGGLVAVVLLAGGFLGGVEVQKRQGSGASAAAGGAGAPFAARLAAGGGGGAGAGGAAGGGGGAGGAAGQAGGQSGRSGAAGGAGASATVGTVANVKGSTLYVTGADGTVKVKTDDTSKVTRNASSSASAVHPGDTVVVQGPKAASGTVTATSVAATAKGIAPAGFGGGGGFPSGARGGAASGASGGGQVPQGFAPPAG